MHSIKLKATTCCVFLRNNLLKTHASGSALFKALSMCIRGKSQSNPHIWVSIPVSITLLCIGLAGILDDFIPDQYLELSWRYYRMWPLQYLEATPWSWVFFIGGVLLLCDTLGFPTRLWQRIIIWWGVFFLLWQLCIYGLLALIIGPIQPVGMVASFLGLTLSYTLLLLFGPPLAILSREGEIKRVQ
jgi:hypothetical protein